MDQAVIDSEKWKLSFGDNNIVHMHLKEKQLVEKKHLQAAFDAIEGNISKKCLLMVTAGEEATMTQEARDLASSDEGAKIMLADAIIIKTLSHQFTANFFIRHNKPKRPMKLFSKEPEAIEWLLAQDK